MSHKGLTYEQIHGPEKAAELRAMRRFPEVTHGKGKTYEERHGVEKAAELREARRQAMIGNNNHGPSKKVICEECGEEFYARGMGLHRRRHENARQYIPERRCIFCEEWIDYYGSHSFCKRCNDLIDEEALDPWGTKNFMVKVAESVRPGYKEKYRRATVHRLTVHPEQHPNRILAKEGRVTEPQWLLYCEVLKYCDCELNHYVRCNGRGRHVDVGIPELMLGFEYDGSYWHQDEEDDVKRDQELMNEGWQIIHMNENDNHVKVVAKTFGESL